MTEKPATDLLTPGEHRALDLLAETWNELNRVVGYTPTRLHDLAELAVHVHALQHAVMAQAAARWYPEKYRRLGEML